MGLRHLPIGAKMWVAKRATHQPISKQSLGYAARAEIRSESEGKCCFAGPKLLGPHCVPMGFFAIESRLVARFNCKRRQQPTRVRLSN